MALTLRHGGDVSGTEPSPSIWGKFNWADAVFHGKAKLFYDNFDGFGLSTAVSSNVGRYGSSGAQYISYEDTGDAIAQLATDDNGVISFTTAATDNNESHLMPGGAASVFGTIDTKATGQRDLLFEARIRIGQLAETAVFVGMSEEGLAAANTLVDDTGAVASKDLIGFHIPAHASVATMSFVHRKAGQAMVTTISGLKTMVASTWYKVGFFLDANEPSAAKRIKVFLDGVEQSTYVTDTAIEAATFPSGEELHFLAGVKAGEAGAKVLSVDWVRIAQMRS
jgi:hypothetical protein